MFPGKYGNNHETLTDVLAQVEHQQPEGISPRDQQQIHQTDSQSLWKDRILGLCLVASTLFLGLRHCRLSLHPLGERRERGWGVSEARVERVKRRVEV